MISVIKKFFKTADKIDESSVEFVVEVPAKTKQELFDDAVKQVVKDKLRVAIFDQMTDACYSKGQLDDTKAAIQYNDGSRTCHVDSVGKLKEKFPNMVCTRISTQTYSISACFDLGKFVDKLVEDAL